MDKLKVGIVGLGNRGIGMTKLIASMEDIEIAAVCDRYDDLVQRAVNGVREVAGYEPKGLADYRDLLNIEGLQAVAVLTSWTDHLKIVMDCMKAGIYSACEVGGAYSLEYDEDGRPVVTCGSAGHGWRPGGR